jgi:PAT family acetyl-CoA transporter-like MFS transporter 1
MLHTRINALTNFSVSNLGGTFPRYFVLKAVDMFTSATCLPPTHAPKADTLTGPAITQAFQSTGEADKHRCLHGGGIYNVTTDGYYIVNILCIVVGVVTFWGYIKPAVMKIQALPPKAWRIASGT